MYSFVMLLASCPRPLHTKLVRGPHHSLKRVGDVDPGVVVRPAYLIVSLLDQFSSGNYHNNIKD